MWDEAPYGVACGTRPPCCGVGGVWDQGEYTMSGLVRGVRGGRGKMRVASERRVPISGGKEVERYE